MKGVVVVSLAALIAAAPGASQTVAPAELKWMDGPPALPGGAQFAVLKGDPGKKGMFTIHLKFPASYIVPPHWHPTDEKVSLVSGKIAYGMSDRFNLANATPLNVGDSVVMKAKMNHWVVTGDGAEVEVSAMGPFQITYVNPSADPRNATRAERGR